VEFAEWEGSSAVGCGTVEWNVLCRNVEHKREMQEGREGDRKTSKHYAISVITLANTSIEVIFFESGTILSVVRPKSKFPEGV